MSIIFSHNTALALLRGVPPQTGRLDRINQQVDLSALSTSAKDLAAFDPEAYGLPRPMHVLCASGETGPTGAHVHTHRMSGRTLPAGALYQLEDNVYVCGPELVFLQMAGALSFVAEVVLGYELCGRYAHFPRLISGFYDRKPLTSTLATRELLDALAGVHGVKAARKALRYVCDGSRSPMETVANAMLFLPSDVGGFGFVEPVPNRRVTFDDTAARIAGKKRCLVDIAWPEQQIGIEYDSDSFHLDPAEDRRRREALAHMGWTVYTIDLDRITGYRALSEMVDLFAGTVPKTTTGKASTVAEQRALLNRLLTATRFGMGMDRVLFSVPVRRGSVATHL